MEKMRRGRKRKRRDWTLPLPFCKNSCGHSCGPGWYELSVKELKIPVLSAVTLKRAGLSRRHSHIYKACAPPRTTFPFRKVSQAYHSSDHRTAPERFFSTADRRRHAGPSWIAEGPRSTPVAGPQQVVLYYIGLHGPQVPDRLIQTVDRPLSATDGLPDDYQIR